MEVFTKSAQETKNLGEKIATNLSKKARLRPLTSSGLRRGKSREEHAIVLALSGELGSGKTTFIQGFAKGLGIPHRILSPTFIISREYTLSDLPFTKFIHIDLYRTQKKTDLDSLGLQEIFANSANIIAIEWAERLVNKLTKAINLTFRAISENERRIIISAKDLRLKNSDL